MNPVIKRELEKVRAPLPDIDETTTKIDIPKKEVAPLITLCKGKSYLIELADYILNEPPNFTLSSNWNRGMKPISKYLIVTVSEIAGNMMQVDGTGYDILSRRYGMDAYHGFWLPLQGIRVVEEIK